MNPSVASAMAQTPWERTQPRRITLVISSLGSGGTERVMSIMANYWAARGREITLITVSSKVVDWYSLDPRVTRVALNMQRTPAHLGEALRNNLQRMRQLRCELRRARPDVLISFGDTTNILALISSFSLGIPVIVSERTDPRQHSIGSAWRRLRCVLYRRADCLVLQTHGLRNWARRLVRDNAIHVIPNPVKPVHKGFEYSPNRQGSARTVVSMGRLSKEKRFDLLLRAFGQCAKMHDNWSLIIVGEGEERQFLETLAVELGLTGRLRFPGLVQDPARLLQGADLFVLSSRYEGFPNALVEAMACGLAVISTDCASSLREIICDGVNGLLVSPNDVNALATAMDRLMANQGERERLGARAVEVTERFGVERVMGMWDAAVQQVYERQMA